VKINISPEELERLLFENPVHCDCDPEFVLDFYPIVGWMHKDQCSENWYFKAEAIQA
jgi:hypothetical protein